MAVDLTNVACVGTEVPGGLVIHSIAILLHSSSTVYKHVDILQTHSVETSVLHVVM